MVSKATSASTVDRLRWWPLVAMLCLLLATGLGVGIGVAQEIRPVSFGGGDIVGVSVLKGEIADFGAYVGRTSGPTITLVGIRLIPVSGYDTPVIVHTAVVRPPSMGADRGWPPAFLKGDVLLPVWDLRVAATPQPRQEDEIVYGVIPSSGEATYAWAGVAVTYTEDGQEFTSPDWDAGSLCVLANVKASCDASYDAADAAIIAVQPG